MSIKIESKQESINLQTYPSPLQSIINIFKSFIGYFLRICVFQFGVFEKGIISRTFIQLYASQIVDFNRIDRSLKLLKKIGGIDEYITTKDGLKLHGMRITRENFEKSVGENGGKVVQYSVKWIDNNYVVVDSTHNQEPGVFQISVIEKQSQKGNSFEEYQKECLEKFGWQTHTLKDRNGKKTSVFILGKSSKKPDQKSKCFVRCHSPGISFSFERKYIAKHLSLGSDVFLFDYRGTYKSEGSPSETGYYLDGEAVIEHLKKDYDISQLWVTGFCAGAATAIYLKAKYHTDKINLIVENTFDSMRNMVRNQLLGSLGVNGMDSLKDPHLAKLFNIEEDGFDSISKLNKLSEKNTSSTIVISTKTDRKVPTGSAEKLLSAAQRTSDIVLGLQHEGFSPNADGHEENPLNNQVLWDQYREFILSV